MKGSATCPRPPSMSLLAVTAAATAAAIAVTLKLWAFG